MKNWKNKRTQREKDLIEILEEVNNDIRLVRKNKKKNYQRNKEVLSKKSCSLQEELSALIQSRKIKNTKDKA